MPDLTWNKRWGEQAKQYQDGDKYFAQHETYGYQWGDPKQTSAAFVIPEYIDAYLGKNKTVLEIGPGGGRYTEFLIKCKKIYLVEYNTEFFAILADKFQNENADISYIPSTGCNLTGVRDNSVDFVFSFDCFVHLDMELIEGYFSEIKRVMTKDAVIVIHYADKRKKLAQDKGTDFANTTPKIMNDLAIKHGFKVIKEDTERISHSAIFALQLADA